MFKKIYQLQKSLTRTWNKVARRILKVANRATYPLELIVWVGNWFATEILGRPLKYVAYAAEIATKVLYRSPILAIKLFASASGINWLFRNIVMGPLVRKANGDLRDYAQGLKLVGQFVAAWFGTRDYQAALGGIPAFMLMLVAGGLVLRLSLISPQQVAAQYQSMALRAFEEENLALANLCNQKLNRLGLDTQGSVFYAALKEFEAGEKASATEKIASLATFGEEDYASAHLWMVQHLVEGKISKDVDRASQLKLAEKHLRRFVEMDPENLAGRAWRAEIYLQWGNERLAYPSLEALVPENPDLAFRMFTSSRKSGDADAIRKDALRVIEYGNTVGPDLLSTERQILVAEAYEEIGEINKAREVVAMGLLGVTDAAKKLQLSKVSGRLALAEYDQIKEIESASVERRIALLKDAIKSNAVEDEVIDRFAELFESGKTSKVSAATIKSLINDADAPADVYLHFGTQAALAGKLPLARKLLAKCLELDPDRPNALNNLAWLLSNSEPVDLDGAMTYVNRALLFSPEDPRYHDTRGHIHLLKKEWKLAIQDLEFATRFGNPTVAVRESLALAYKQLQNASLESTGTTSLGDSAGAQ